MRIFLLILLTAMQFINLFAQQPINHNSVVEINEHDVQFEPNKIIIKLHEQFAYIDLSAEGAGVSNAFIPALAQLNQEYRVKSIKKLFPFVRKINLQPNDLTTIYEIEYEHEISPIELSTKYAAIPEIEFAEPDYIASILVNPNDPYYKNGSQTYHSAVKANDAWELTTGDATQIIGIIDTGVDWEHEDLKDNIWVNVAERDGTTGIDDDNNGFMDDIRGWDFVNDDNNPMDDNSHGTHVAGIAGAKTNNNIGIAGISWNSKLMAVKVMQSSGRGSWSDIAQGAAYAAENGTTIINMSLGGYTESLTMKTALENAYHYSVLVAAAGNDGMCIGAGECLGFPMYPAVYSWVLGVQASNSTGSRTSWSNYDPTGPTEFRNPFGYNYEVLAPGQNIYSTIPGNGYRYLSGTSMATPVTSGAVALIKSYLPNISTEELFVRIIQASGSGVLDIEGAMTIELLPDIKLNKFSIVDTLDGCDRDGVADAGETVILNIEARNYGGLAQNVKAKIRFGEFEDTSTLTIDDSTATFGNVSAYARVNNDANPFQLTISDDVSNDRDIVLQLEISNDTDETKYFKNIIITAQNGEELKGYNPGLTHLTANRYYLLTENAVFDSLIIDPGVEINAYENTAIGIYDYLSSIGKVDSLITFKSLNQNKWNFIKSMDGMLTLNFNYIKVSQLHAYIHGKLNFFNSLFYENSYVNLSGGLLKKCNVINNVSNTNPYSYWFYVVENLIFCNNSRNNQVKQPLLWVNGHMHFNSFYNNYESNFTKRVNSIRLENFNNTTINDILPTYFGSVKQNDIDFELMDYFENSSLPIITCTNFLTEPHPDVHGHAWAILLNNENPYYKDLDPFGNETVKFDVFFSRSMDTSFTPFLTFGVREPYTQKAVVDSARWVNWKRDSTTGDTYYNIQVSADSTFSTIDYQKSDVLGLDYQFDLEPDKHYYWRVRYKNGTNGDWQKWSEVSNFWTKPSTAPNPPEIIHPKNGDDDLWTDFQIRWKENPYSIGYDIQIDDDNTFATPLINDTTHYLSNYYNVVGLERGETYFLRVRTNNAYGTSDWSDIVSFEIVGNTPRGPELISPADSSLGISYLTKFEWEDLDWATTYRIQIAFDSLFNNNHRNEVINKPTYDYYSQPYNYWWRVQGIKGSEVGAWSNKFYFTGNNNPTNENLVIISPLDSSRQNIGKFVTFKWINNFNSLEYNIEIYDSYNMSNLLINKTLIYPDTTLNYSELLNIGKYYWRIRVYGRNGYGNWSKLYMFEITKDLDPKPLLSVPTNNMKWYDTTLTFKWNNAPGANTVYNARWQAYHTMDFTTGDGLQMIRVAGAKDNEGFEIPIEWNRFQFEVQATAALSNDFIADGKVGKIELEWGMPDVERDILGFNMYRFVQKDSVTWGDTVKVNNILIVDSTYTDYDIKPDSTYYYVYRIVRTTLDEGEDSRMVWASAYPTVLEAPALVYPPNDTTKLPVNIAFDWDEPSGATNYIIQISKDANFSDIIINENVEVSNYLSSILNNRTKYYWRVKAEGIQGTSAWSQVRSFTTIPILPAVPTLEFPANNSISQPLSMTFNWANANEADFYHLQISDDEFFGNLIYDVTNLLSSQSYVGNLAINKTYYWRVRSKNIAGFSNWSSKWLFTTDTAGATLPPSSWNFVDNTGNSSIIVVPKNINPIINGRAILPGDAIGIFFKDEGISKCAGYGIWEGNNLAITVWGDDDQTPDKDGFVENEDYKIRLWDSRAEKEFTGDFSVSSGNAYYTINGYTVLGNLITATEESQNIYLAKSWNLLSSYIIANNDSLENIFKEVGDNLVIMKELNGNVYIPSYEINTIGKWDYKKGYQAYLSNSDTLSILGIAAKPNQEKLYLTSGWTYISYLRKTALGIENCLESLTETNSLIIAKNSKGLVYIPSYDINTIGDMQPGQGYQVYLNKTDTLIYPANSLGKYSNTKTKTTPVAKYLESEHSNTGSNSTIIIRINADNYDELGVYNSEGKLVGSGAVYNGVAAVTVWGDNDQTEEIDGAVVNDELRIKNYDVSSGLLSEVENILISDAKGTSFVNSIPYKKDGITIAEIRLEEKASDLFLDINPNPASTTFEISYSLDNANNCSIKIYNNKGVMVDEITNLNDNKYTYNSNKLSSGTYTVILNCDEQVLMRKLIIAK